MNYLQEKFHKTGYKNYFIAEKLDITDKTLGNWLNLKGIDFSVKFMELLHICDIHMCDFLNIYYKTDKYKCKHCEMKNHP